MGQESRETIQKVEINCDDCEIVHIAKQKAKEGHAILAVNCLNDNKGMVKVTG